VNARLPTLKPEFGAWNQAAAARHRAVPARDPEGRLWLLGDREVDPLLLQAVESRLGTALRWQRCDPGLLDAWLTEAERDFRALDGVAQAETADGAQADAPELSVVQMSEQASPAVRLLDAVLYDALKDGASDIHFENHARGADVRLRIDGVLLPVRRVEGTALAEQMVSRLKVMAELDIGERRLPQDGRFKLRAAGREIDFRLSVIPSVFGEDAVIRVLDRAAIEHEAGSLTLAALGFDDTMRAAIKAVASRPHGMLLVTGPTGSGKTTTLYAAITETNTGREKVITIEDPVEYQLPGVVQIPVNEKKGLTFARGLRSILRHDPDRVMVGEIRDAETAQIAVQAALTGHLVFSTVHANNAFDVLGRFMHMGLDLYNVVAALEAVMAQRLMRQVCGHCGVDLEPTVAQRALLDGGTARTEAPVTCRVGIGCAHCRGTGYRGRRAVSELLLFDDELRDLIAGRAPMSKIKQSARERGMQSLRSAALDAVRQGWTTFEELDRVTVDA
jgi:general secretion pathway protein E